MSITPAWRTTLMSNPRRSSHLLRCATRPIQRDIQHTRSQSLHSSSSQLQDESNRPQRKTKKPETRYNFNTSLSFHEDTDPEHLKYRRVTAKDLSRRHEPPTRVKMLVRDFIDDSLYNPQYGYFSKQAEVFSTTPTPSPSSSSTPSTPSILSSSLDISSFPDLTAFQEAIAEQYTTSYDRPSRKKGKRRKLEVGVDGKDGEGFDVVEDSAGGLTRQVWHTPTELFKPHYAHIICQALLYHYQLHHYPYSDFQIYEIGAGNGSLMIDMLTYLRRYHPHIFERTKYTIIEISEALATRQRERVKAMEEQDPAWKGKVTVDNVDWFEWEGSSKESCYFVALEVFDNFAHDMIRYDLQTLEPLQATVCIDASGDFSLLYEPVSDPVIRRYLGYRRLLPPGPSSSVPPINPLLLSSSVIRNFYAALPFAPNLSKPEFIPTKQMLFLERLRDRLPFHKLLMSDFDKLPDAVEGKDGPVVQTRYGGSMVPCETFLVKQGYFDIFFPTNFEKLKDIYFLIMNSSSRRLSPSFFSHQGTNNNGKATPASTKKAKKIQVQQDAMASQSRSDLIGIRGFRQQNVSIYGHAEFLEQFGGEKEIKGTTTKDGGNVMLGMYKNAKFIF